MVAGRQIGVASRNRRKLPGEQARHGLGKYEIGVQVGVMRVAAIARPPARVQRKLHQVRQPSNLLSATRFAAGHLPEPVGPTSKIFDFVSSTSLLRVLFIWMRL